ncbi:MAG: hypothetical protein CM1200mP30_21650 [Pseudomonadota bacterium]|nr:MAG: hypothetical protein CM1200mP30_21650 [Pseudomonadota bacterium]
MGLQGLAEATDFDELTRHQKKKSGNHHCHCHIEYETGIDTMLTSIAPVMLTMLKKMITGAAQMDGAILVVSLPMDQCLKHVNIYC